MDERILNISKAQAVTDTSGYALIEHNASETPYYVQVQGVKVAGADAVWQANTDQYTATTFRVRCLNSLGAAHASKIVEVYFIAYKTL